MTSRFIALSLAVLAIACHKDSEQTDAGATSATGGMSAPTGGTTAGRTAPTAGRGTVTPDGGTQTGSAGRAGTASVAGAGGVANTGGAGNPAGAGSGGISNTAGTTAGQGPAAGSGSQAPLCEAIGFAARQGRMGAEYALRGGGDTTPVVVSSFAELASLAKDDTPRVIHIDSSTNKVGAGWSGTSGDRLELGSNKTIVGLHPGTELKAPIHIKNASNVIVRNLVIHGPGSSSDQAWDNLNIEGPAKNIWIDHCAFWDGQDGNADVVKGADNVTFTWNIFGYRTDGKHNFSNLVASSDDEPESEGKLNITLMFNWFSGAAQRQPRCRYGNIHVVNNLYTRDDQTSDYAISAGKDCKVITEANHFVDINEPIYTSHASGSAANELRGDNIFENTKGNTTGYGTAFDPPYDYKQVLVPATEVQALVKQKAGATLDRPSACD